MGLMWSNADDAVHINTNLRHTCEQNDGVTRYGWTSYEPRRGGTHIFNDTGNKVDLTVDFVKFPDAEGDWGLRIQGVPTADAPRTQKTTVVFYIGSEAKDSWLDCGNSSSGEPEHVLDIDCSGELAALSDYEIKVRPSLRQTTTNDNAVVTNIQSLWVPRDSIWQAKSIFLDQLNKGGQRGTFLQDSLGRGNLHLIQLTFTGDIDFDVLFSSGHKSAPLSATSLTDSIQEAGTAFESHFRATYQPEPPFHDPAFTKLSQSLLSNLLGGIGFFHGTSKISSNRSFEKATITSADEAVEDQGPYSLFTAVPSRPFFPRGFLWDEGFHLQVIVDWDLDLAVEILMSWFDLMDESGWIAREQILGPEARSKVPLEFQTQYQSYANPPTLFLVVDMVLERYSGRVPYNGHPSMYMEGVQYGRATGAPSGSARAFLQKVFPKLRLHCAWFRRTQSGNLDKYRYLHADSEANHTEGYRWRGRTPQHILTSGLDDYPRAPIPSEDELHLDALCWVNLMAQVLSKVATALHGRSDPGILNYEAVSKEAHTTAEAIHWSDASSAYCDVTISPVTDQREHVCHKGYVSLLPFVTNTMSPDRIAAVLDLIADPAHLWSPYGLRSLSTEDEYYGTGEDYWCSPIWVNINYLVLVRLLHLAGEEGSPHRRRAGRLYTQLRENLVNTVAESWKQTGSAWEQYNADTGKGQGTQHFTGWTSLIVRIMAMPQLGGQEPHDYGHGRVSGSYSTKPLMALSGGTLLAPVTVALFIIALWFRRRIFSLCRRLTAGS
ncbi:hypothetical protein LTR36_006158 [Oleoguttula mirabilis]|uniref:Mannosyl-oligosaccharide glucosidase n=1 Tax=Oleoguttula mirabilis TaxID=1507867 RepID=A0AAV9JCA6_9PEZI|nr:hypothetical protein LTR36_006158 [Oleoguttula mirabilis]